MMSPKTPIFQALSSPKTPFQGPRVGSNIKSDTKIEFYGQKYYGQLMNSVFSALFEFWLSKSAILCTVQRRKLNLVAFERGKSQKCDDV